MTRVLFLTGTLAVLPPDQNGVVQDGNPIAWISKEMNLHDMECSMYSLHVINKLKSRKKFVKPLALFDQKRMYLFPSPWLGCSLAIDTRKRGSFNYSAVRFYLTLTAHKFFSACTQPPCFIFSLKQRPMYTEVFLLEILLFFLTKKEKLNGGRCRLRSKCFCAV